MEVISNFNEPSEHFLLIGVLSDGLLNAELVLDEGVLGLLLIWEKLLEQGGYQGLLHGLLGSCDFKVALDPPYDELGLLVC